jgi:beta-lactamase class A
MRERSKKIIYLLLVILASAGSFYYGRLSVKLPAMPKEKAEAELRLAGYKFVNPLLECEIFDATPANSALLEKMKQEIRSRLALSSQASSSIYFRDLNNGPWIGINERDKFTPASLMKVPLLMAGFKSREKDRAFFDKKVLYVKQQEPFEANIKSPIALKNGLQYDLWRIVESMIINSDNDAASLLLEKLDRQSLKSVFHDLKVPDPEGGPTEDYMSVKDYASFFRILYNASYLSNEDSEQALKLLSQSVFDQGLVAGLPKDIIVAHKFGERKYEKQGQEIKQLHDCGIIYADKKNYILCVMSRGDDFVELEKIIADISRIVYNNFVLGK